MTHRTRRGLCAIVSTLAVLLLVLSVTALGVWVHERAELRRRVVDAIDAAAPPSVQMRQALAFLHANVPLERRDGYFLLPLFRFLKPTALEVLRDGGDCAYRARALIVILNQYDVRAFKLALYDETGRSVHAVVQVETERGPYVVDALFDFVYEANDGRPLPRAALAAPEVVRSAMTRAAAGGNTRALRYPVERYPYTDVRTVNWTKSATLRAAYRALVAIVGQERANHLPRPYLTEEPGLMVLAASGSGLVVCVVLLLRLRRAALAAAAGEGPARSGLVRSNGDGAR